MYEYRVSSVRIGYCDGLLRELADVLQRLFRIVRDSQCSIIALEKKSLLIRNQDEHANTVHSLIALRLM